MLYNMWRIINRIHWTDRFIRFLTINSGQSAKRRQCLIVEQTLKEIENNILG